MEELHFNDLRGKIILIGITYCSDENEVVDQRQYWGTVIEANETIISVKRRSGEIFGLPPDLSSIRKAAAGEYRLNSTGEVVVDPDYLTTWTVILPTKEPEALQDLINSNDLRGYL